MEMELNMCRAYLLTVLCVLCCALSQGHSSGHVIAQRSAPDASKPEKPITKTYEELQMPAVGSTPNAWNNNKDWELVSPQNTAALPQWSGNWFSRRQFGNDPFFTSHSSFPSPSKPTYPFSGDRENPFDTIDTQKPGVVTKTSVDDNGNRVITTYSAGPTHWATQSVMYPGRTYVTSGTNYPNPFEIPELVPPTTTASTVTTTTTIKTPPTPSQLPSLHDFLQSQYGPKGTNSASRPLEEIPTTPTPSLDAVLKTIPTTTTPTKVTTLRVEDLPVTQVLNNGKEADDEFLLRLPKDLRPATFIPNTFKVDNIPRSESGTSITSLTKTVNSANLPTANDLDPRMRDILEKAHINPNDINPFTGNTITKTRIEPDGRQITTTYKVEPVPVANSAPGSDNLDTEVFRTVAHPASPSFSAPYPSAYPWNTYIPNYPGNPFYPATTYPLGSVPPQNIQPQGISNPIDEFLAKLGISTKQILDNKGEFLKTIVDSNGRVLTASFTLSTVRGVAEDTKDEHTTPQPIK